MAAQMLRAPRPVRGQAKSSAQRHAREGEFGQAKFAAARNDDASERECGAALASTTWFRDEVCVRMRPHAIASFQ
jgi:hypothetical protein